MQWIKDIINYLSDPKIYFTFMVISWWALMKYHKVWVKPKTIKAALWGSFIGLGFALTDANFFKEATKPDNIPIWLMSYGVAFFFWLSISRGTKNDELLEQGLPNLEKQESDKKVYTWPDLVYSELICIVAFAAFLLIWGVVFPAPLEDPANSGITPPIAKAPWYFLGLQELLVYYDPWIAGVVLPVFIIIGLIAIPYFDINPKGNGYYTVKERFSAIWFFGFGFIVLWIALIFLGTFMRGPGWNFFGPFEYWDTHKVVPLNNINLSEIIWVKLLNVGLPVNILLRECVGFVIVGLYLIAIPPLLAKGKLKDLYNKMGFVRYNLFIFLILVMTSLPIKMYLRWAFNLKYIISVPEFLFNI
jgi:uncharacterized membrane protein YwzB